MLYEKKNEMTNESVLKAVKKANADDLRSKFPWIPAEMTDDRLWEFCLMSIRHHEESKREDAVFLTGLMERAEKEGAPDDAKATIKRLLKEVAERD